MLVRQIIFLSLVFISIGLLIWRERNRLLKKWKKASATIVKNIYVPNELALFEPMDPNNDETATYYPVVEFETAKNETITKQLETAFYPPGRLGKKLVVLYNPDDPTSLITYPKTKLEILPKAMIILGLIGLMFCLLHAIKIISIPAN